MEDNGSLIQYDHTKETEILIQRAKKLKGTTQGSCVTFARNFLRLSGDEIKGVAKNLRTNSETPEVGAIGKTNESRYGHLFVIIGIEGENLTIVDSNYGWDNKVRIRQLSTQDRRILGYWRGGENK